MKSGLVALMRYFSLWSRAHISLASSQVMLPLETLVQERTGAARPLFAFALGTAGRFRKLTAQAMTETGDVLGYLKLPLTADAIRRVQHEAEILAQLQEHPHLDGKVPKPLFAGRWGSKFLLFTAPGPAVPASAEFSPSHLALLDSIHSVRAEQRRGSDLVQEVASGWEQVASSMRDRALAELVQEALHTAQQGLGNAMLECGLSHGDFAPWNLRGRNGDLFVCDWEAARFHMPRAWDRFHFEVQSEGLLHKQIRRTAQLTVVEQSSFLVFLVDSICQSIQEDLGGSSARDIAYKRKILSRELQTARRWSQVAV